MTGPEAAFQDALTARLAADAGVQALLGNPARLYDEAPAGTAYPFATLGRAVSEDRSADGTALIEHRLSLHVWTRHGGRREAKAIIEALRAAAHDQVFALEGGWSLVSCRAVYADAFRTAEPRIAHGVLRFKAVIQTPSQETDP